MARSSLRTDDFGGSIIYDPIMHAIPLNLLVGLSILIDQPSIQSCNILFLYFAAIIVASQWYLIIFSIGLIATVQLLIIECGRKRVSTRKVHLAFAVLMSFVMAFSIVQCVVGLWNETFTVVVGLIYTVTSDDATFLIGMVLVRYFGLIYIRYTLN